MYNTTKKDQFCAAVMKQYLFDTSHKHLVATCIKQQAVRKFVLAQNVTKGKDTFTFVSQFFGSCCSLEVRSEIKEGLMYLKTRHA